MSQEARSAAQGHDAATISEDGGFAFREWLLRLAEDLDRAGYHVSHEYPYQGSMLKLYGRQATEWLDELGAKASE